MAKETLKYDASAIQVLHGLEPVRKRPGMYIGSTGASGLHHLIWEVVDNGIDEALAGFATEIMVILEDEGVTVIDNGRGIPVDIHKGTKKSALETVLTTLHAGGKFDRAVYKVAGGLHGVGVSVVNALSERLRALVKRDGKFYFQEYTRGKPLSKVREITPEEIKKKGLVPFSYETGTLISFSPDPQIFDTLEFDRETIIDHLRQQAFLTKGIKIIFVDKRKKKDAKGLDLLLYNEPYIFQFESGVKAYLEYLVARKKPLTPTIAFSGKVGEIIIDVGLAYINDFNEHLYGFANNIYTEEGGMHLTGFRAAISRVVSDLAKKLNNDSSKKEEIVITGEDVREGLVAVISVKLPEPQFEGQTKSKLGNPEARTAVESLVSEKFSTFLEENPQVAKTILEKVFLAAKARLAAKAAKESVLRKGLLDGLSLPGKLSDCASRKPEESELFLVEGESAGGNAKQARDSYFQAILPLRGKILNIEKSRFDKILKNNEIRTIIMALGMGMGEEKDINKLRYHRIILMTDADVDGSHIKTLLLTFFFRFFPEIITNGHLYIAQPPLYKIESQNKVFYAYSDKQKEEIIKNLKNKTFDVQRYKGLGEMNPQQLWETTMDPEARILSKVTLQDAEEADRIFSTLMGEEVEERKKFIQTKASEAKNLDI